VTDTPSTPTEHDAREPAREERARMRTGPYRYLGDISRFSLFLDRLRENIQHRQTGVNAG
jgi:hypothetical protein